MTKSYQHLTVGDRLLIEHERRKGTSYKDLAQLLDKHPTTVSREVRRNAVHNGRYDHEVAHRLALARRSLASSQPHSETAQFWFEFAQTLRQKSPKMSPELHYGRTTQVDGRACLSRSWLYELVHRDRLQGGDVYTFLPRRGRKYRKRVPSAASSSKIPNRIDIDQRPPEVAARNTLGHWEIDTVIGHGHQGVLLTAIERCSRLTRIRVLPHRKAKLIAFAILDMLLPVKHRVQTITVDNGLEFTEHTFVANLLNAQFYFCKPYHSWQRGQIEHLNGRVRRTFRKKQSFRHLTREEIAREEQQLNQMPRKCLHYRTPEEVFYSNKAQAPP